MSDLNSSMFKQTLLEFISEIQDILQSGRYNVPDNISYELKMAKIALAAASIELVTDIMISFGKEILPLEKEIKQKDVAFFAKLHSSSVVKELDTGTFIAAKYVIDQAIQDNTPTKKEDIDIIFEYISSLVAAAKQHKKR